MMITSGSLVSIFTVNCSHILLLPAPLVIPVAHALLRAASPLMATLNRRRTLRCPTNTGVGGVVLVTTGMLTGTRTNCGVSVLRTPKYTTHKTTRAAAATTAHLHQNTGRFSA